MFDPAAPTITVEDIQAHQERRKQLLEERARESDRLRQESERRARQCYTSASVPSAESVAKPAPATSPAPAQQEDLRSVSTNELIARLQRGPDAALIAELQRRAQSGTPAVSPSSPSPNALEQLARVPGMDSRMADQLRLAARDSDPKVQACLKAAERIVDQPDEPPVDFVNIESNDTLPVRDGRTTSFVYDIAGQDADDAPASWRYNIVLRSGPHGAVAVPMRDAMARSKVKAGWARVTEKDTVRSLEILNKPSPLSQSRSKGSPASMGEAINELKDKLKEVPR